VRVRVRVGARAEIDSTKVGTAVLGLQIDPVVTRPCRAAVGHEGRG